MSFNKFLDLNETSTITIKHNIMYVLRQVITMILKLLSMMNNLEDKLHEKKMNLQNQINQ